MANTVTYAQIFDSVLQQRLNLPQTWKDVCEVRIADTRIINTSYESTQPAITTVTRGTGFVIQDFVQTNNTLTISTGRDLATFSDWGDLGQSPWTTGVEQFKRIGNRLNEFVETQFLADQASWTDFDNASIGGGAGNITVSANNVDDIIRGIKREIRENNAAELANERGTCFVWRAADFEYLEAFVQANGFQTADTALKEGTAPGLRYMAADHYYSNSHTAGHVFAGVKKVVMIGLLRTTYGRAHTIEFPAGSTNNNLSGVAWYSRVDMGALTPGGLSTAVFDITVA